MTLWTRLSDPLLTNKAMQNIIKVNCKCKWCRNVASPFKVYPWKARKVKEIMEKRMNEVQDMKKRNPGLYPNPICEGIFNIHKGMDVELTTYKYVSSHHSILIDLVSKMDDKETLNKILSTPYAKQ